MLLLIPESAFSAIHLVCSIFVGLSTARLLQAAPPDYYPALPCIVRLALYRVDKELKAMLARAEPLDTLTPLTDIQRLGERYTTIVASVLGAWIASACDVRLRSRSFLCALNIYICVYEACFLLSSTAHPLPPCDSTCTLLRGSARRYIPLGRVAGLLARRHHPPLLWWTILFVSY